MIILRYPRATLRNDYIRAGIGLYACRWP